MTFFSGIHTFFEALRQVGRRDLRSFVVIPALLSLVIVAGGLFVAFGFIGEFSAYLAGLGIWSGLLDWLLEPLLYLLGILVGAWLFGFVALLIGSPFLGDLNLKVDPPEHHIPVAWYQQLWPTIRRELRKLRYTFPRLVGLLVLSFIPVINLIAPLLLLGYGGWLMAVQFCDFSFENRSQSFDETLQILRGARAYAIGFGICVTFAMSIPLLNFIVAPVACIGGALCVRTIRSRKPQPQRGQDAD